MQLTKQAIEIYCRTVVATTDFANGYDQWRSTFGNDYLQYSGGQTPRSNQSLRISNNIRYAGMSARLSVLSFYLCKIGVVLMAGNIEDL